MKKQYYTRLERKSNLDCIIRQLETISTDLKSALKLLTISPSPRFLFSLGFCSLALFIFVNMACFVSVTKYKEVSVSMTIEQCPVDDERLKNFLHGNILHLIVSIDYFYFCIFVSSVDFVHRLQLQLLETFIINSEGNFTIPKSIRDSCSSKRIFKRFL